MTDRREQILVRLLGLAQDLPGIVTAFRNMDEISDRQRPAIVILDADEAADDADPAGLARRPNAPRRISMTPEIYLMLGASPTDVGTLINGLRAAFIKAVLTDSDLAGIVGPNGDVRYEGCATGLARGRNMEAEMGLSFTFSYILRPDEL